MRDDSIPRTSPLLVLAAHDSETRPLRKRSSARLATVGVGLALSGAGAARVLAEQAPSAVLLVGTCGAYPGRGLALGDVVVARALRLVCPAAVEGRAEFPDPMPRDLEAHERMRTALAAGARLADVATTLAVTTDDALAARVAAGTGADVEHLEAFAIATACASAGVPFAAVLGVANAVGSTARAEWRAHHGAASDAVAGHVARWLDGGAAGVP